MCFPVSSYWLLYSNICCVRCCHGWRTLKFQHYGEVLKDWVATNCILLNRILQWLLVVNYKNERYIQRIMDKETLWCKSLLEQILITKFPIQSTRELLALRVEVLSEAFGGLICTQICARGLSELKISEHYTCWNPVIRICKVLYFSLADHVLKKIKPTEEFRLKGQIIQFKKRMQNKASKLGSCLP